MAEVKVHKDELLATKEMNTTFENQLRTELNRIGLGLGAQDEVAFAVFVIDRRKGGTAHDPPDPKNGEYKIQVMHASTRNLVSVDYRVAHSQRHFPANTPINPQPKGSGGATKDELFEVIYQDDEYIGYCTVIGGKPVWF